MSEAYEKIREIAFHIVNLYVAIDSLPTLQIPLRIVELFEKIYDGEPILTVFSNIGEDVHYLYPIPLFQWRVLCEKDRACTDLFENLSKNS